MPDQAEPIRDNLLHWNEVLAPRYIRFRAPWSRALSAYETVLLEALSPALGDRVLDVGCGFGETALNLGRRVGPAGEVVGVDCCGAFIDLAGEARDRAGLRHVRFVEGDVQTLPFHGDFDACVSRFGAMFFDDPVQGLRHLRTALKPGCILALLVWRSLEDNPWWRIPKAVVRRFLPAEDDEVPVAGPGPFSMADPERVSGQLERAGFREVSVQPVDAPVLLGPTLEQAIDFLLTFGPAGGIIREAQTLTEKQAAAIRTELGVELAAYTNDGAVTLPSAAWLVRAKQAPPP